MPQSSAGNNRGWQVLEEESYERAVAQCGTFQFFDEVLAPIEYALHRNPGGFPAVPGFEGIKLAKTKLRLIQSEIIPSFRLWFKLNIASRQVSKLWIDMAPPEDMAYGESLWDEDDDIPF